MEENRETLELLRKIQQDTAQQLRLGKLRCIFSGVSAACFVIVLVLLVNLLPQANEIMTQLDTVLSNLEQTTQQLAQADLGAMVENVNTLVLTGQVSLEQTMEKLNAIDFETLNQAIQDLAAVIQPLVKLTNLFGK